jgi:DNA cross-link repair 1A protein
MITFEVPGHRPLLHTGDCRLSAEMQDEPTLRALRGKADLILDTTYCDPQYDFPPQAEVSEKNRCSA